MKKTGVMTVVFLVLCAAFMFGKNKKVDEDFKALEEFFLQGYAAYDDVKDTFDAQKEIKNLSKTYDLTLKARKKAPGGDSNDHYVNGINAEVMGSCINYFFWQSGIKDGHLRIKSDFFNWKVCPVFELYRSNIYFEAQDGKNIVYKSDFPLIKRGDVYTGKLENLYRVILDGKEVYQFSVLSANSISRAKISVENKEFDVGLNLSGSYLDNNKFTGFKESENSAYFSFGFFDALMSEKQKMQEFEDLLVKIRNSAPKKNVIIDLRSNTGGYEYFIREFLGTLAQKYTGTDQKTVDYVFERASSGILELNSPVIAKIDYEKELQRNMNQDFINQKLQRYEEQKKSPKRYYDGILASSLDVLPQIKNDTGTKIYIIIDNYTASSTELCVAYAYIFGKDFVTLIGENTTGSLDYANYFDYQLPNSLITVRLSANSLKKIPALRYNSHWHGDTNGFFPDYWSDSSQLLNTLLYLTDDTSLKTALAELDKGQL